MLKKLVSIVVTLTFVLQILLSPSYAAADNTKKVRGLWVASVLNLDYPTTATSDAEQLKAQALAVLNRAQSIGFNTIYLQVRPTADALYQSDIFPWSSYLTGTMGQAPTNNFDPLAFWVEEAHKRDIELHAWLNPYRITKRKSGDPAMTPEQLVNDHPAKLHPDWVVSHGGGDLYFDPALPEVQQLIVSGVKEIIQRYDVDGIHFDDYFYPGTDFNDDASYQRYGEGADKADWRRANVNRMVRACYTAIKRHDSTLEFGISPFGIWGNAKDIPGGSLTKGNQSYTAHYADSLAWIKEGIIDYIAPQIYWHIGFDIADYPTLVNWWIKQVAGTNVKLIIGQAAYRTGNSSQKSPWYGDDQIFRQLAYNMTMPALAGSIFFRDGSFKASPSLSSRMKDYYQMLDRGETYNRISVNFPRDNHSTTLSTYYISGYANPYKPLYINGSIVTYRSPKGYFGVPVSLKNGNNRFAFTQAGDEQVISIYRGYRSSAGSAPDVATPTIKESSAYPLSQEMYTSGQTIKLRCQAPVGAVVKATFNGEEIRLYPASKTAGNTLRWTTFSSAYRLPKIAEGKDVQIFAAPRYTMTLNGKTDRVTAAGNFSVLAENANIYARVIADYVDTYFEQNPRKGSDYILEKGMVDRVKAVTNRYVQLASGRWIYRKNVSLFSYLNPQYNRVDRARYQSGDRFDYVDIAMSEPSAVSLQLKDGVLSATFANTLALPEVENIAQGMLQSVKSAANRDRTVYYFRFKNFADLHGYYAEKTSDGVRIYFKKPVFASAGNRPLEGIRVLIDPGHGGEDSGAVGLMGAAFSEKHINIETSRQLKAALESRGAQVSLTRDDDITLSLQERLRISFEQKPDMFISMHADSIGPNRNLSFVRGFSAHYKREIAKALTDAVSSNVIGQLRRYNRGTRVNNFYVVRGTWTPSFLLEAGFVPNALEFEWMTHNNQQRAYAEAIADGIVEFFRR